MVGISGGWVVRASGGWVVGASAGWVVCCSAVAWEPTVPETHAICK